MTLFLLIHFFPLLPNLLYPSWTPAVTPASLGQPSSSLLIDSEWHAGETTGAALCEEMCTSASPKPNQPPERTFDQLSFDQETIWMDLSSAEIAVKLLNQTFSLFLDLNCGSTKRVTSACKKRNKQRKNINLHQPWTEANPRFHHLRPVIGLQWSARGSHFTSDAFLIPELSASTDLNTLQS